MSERDPRIDPRVGDELRKVNQSRRVRSLYHRADGKPWKLSTECTVGGYHAWYGFPTLTQWRAWAKNAVVVAKGEA